MTTSSLNRLFAYLKRRRTEAKLSVREVAERAGFHPAFIYRVEAGAYENLGIETLQKLAKGYGVPLEVVLIAAGYVSKDAPKEFIPDLQTYLRTHVGLTEQAAREAEGFIEYSKRKYGKRSRS